MDSPDLTLVYRHDRTMVVDPGAAEYEDFFRHALDFAEPGGTVWPQPGPAARWQAQWRRELRCLGDEAPGLGDLAGTQGLTATRAQLADVGISRRRIARRLRDGTWWAPYRGVVALSAAGDSSFDSRRRRHALLCAAAGHRLGAGAVGHRSAAILHGLPTLRTPDRAELAEPLPRTGHRNRPSRLPGHEVSTWFGVPVTSVARTVADVARSDRRGGLVAFDAALHERLIAPADLEDVLRGQGGWPGVRQAREVLTLGSSLAESPLESLTRLALHDSGLPLPQLQVEIPIPARGVAYRVDMAWPELRVVLECDGRVKYSDDALWREKRRENDLRRAGWRVERVTWSDILACWPATYRLLHAVLVAANRG